MELFWTCLLTIAVAVAGGFLFTKIKAPAPFMVGSMFAVAALSVCTGLGYFPDALRPVTQSVAGSFIALSIQPENVKELRSVIKPYFVMVPGMLIINILLGLSMYYFCGMDISTALFSSVPGGIMDISLICADMGANTSQVAIMQTARLLFVMLLFPPMLKTLANRTLKKQQAEGQATAQDAPASQPDAVAEDIPVEKYAALTRRQQVLYTFITLAIGGVGGFIGYKLAIPAGTMTFSLLFAAAFNLITRRAYMPVFVRQAAQVGSGALIGAGLTLADILAMRTIIVPAIILIFGYVIMNLGLGYIIYKAKMLDLTTALFATTPAGASDMALIADELGASGPKVSVLHIARIITVVALFPSVIALVIGAVT
ncbi:Putative ammonia monooxygenase [uncultured Clostridium sp.]|nr:Putative ammonia monooxygenase [uncultured Clostridium sp.]